MISSTQLVQMDDLRFYFLFNGISVIPGRWLDDNERLETFPPQAGLEPETAGSVFSMPALNLLSYRPSGHMKINDVVLTSMRRDDVASTL